MKQTVANIEADASRARPISPYIYGANFPDWARMGGLPFPLARQGGNRLTAYNWETNASNAGNDYQHQNDGFMGASDEPGWSVRGYVDGARAHHATAIVTVPMAGYVAADKNGGGDVNKTPDYLNKRFFRSLPKKPGKIAFPPDTHDSTVYQDEFVAWVEKIRGDIAVWYALDNEPDLWSSTHARIVPKTPGYAEFIARSVEYASAIKAVAPRSLVLGPVSYGWQGFRRLQNAPDAGNREFLDVYLAGLKDASAKSGKRLLDVLDLHWYPEARGGNVRITEESKNPQTAEARIQAPRSLWDPTYVESSWISQSLGNQPIALLPRVQKQINSNYPGTRLGFTEYHYGGRRDISGVISQADVLGIFGRYGVFAACIWGMDARDTAQLAAFRAFLNFDSRGARFGDMSLAVKGETPAENSVYVARNGMRSNVFTVVALNKTVSAKPFSVVISGMGARSASAWTIAGTDLSRSETLPASVSGGKVTFTAPPLSVVSVSVAVTTG